MRSGTSSRRSANRISAVAGRWGWGEGIVGRMRLLRFVPFALSVAFATAGFCATPAPGASAEKPVLFNTAFESGSIGLIEKLSETEFRLHIKGQQDSRGRNRQATW